MTMCEKNRPSPKMIRSSVNVGIAKEIQVLENTVTIQNREVM